MLLAAVQTSFWNTTIAGSIYGFLSATIIFCLTTWYNEAIRKKTIRQELFKNFIQSNEALISMLENSNFNDIDHEIVRKATQNIQLLLLKKGPLRDNLEELKVIFMLKGDEFRGRKQDIPYLLKKISRLLKKQRDELL